MKAKKASVAVLLFLSLAVWSMVGWRVYAGLHEPPIENPQPKIPERDIRQETPELLLNYRDPFGDITRKVETHTSKTQLKTDRDSIRSHRSQKTEIQPSIRYKGTVRVGAIIRAIVENNGESMLLECKDRIGDFTVLNITEEMLIIEQKGNKYKINIE